jgi:hypothetical protein
MEMKSSRRKFLITSSGVLVGLIAPISKIMASSHKNIGGKVLSVSDLLAEWAYLAKWRTIHGYPAAAMHNATMRAMSKKYVLDHYDAHGSLPTGLHVVSYMCGEDPSNDITSGFVTASRRIEERFKYPGEEFLKFVRFK